MSDYLWDKTGARDAEVERLENLLGQLRHGPQPFTLPDELTTRARDAAASGVEEAETARTFFDARALPARRHSRTSWLAIAAVLLLAFVALALALLRTGGNVQQSQQVGLENSRQDRQQQSANSQPHDAAPQVAASPTQDVAPPSQHDFAPSRETVANAGAPAKRGEQVIASGLAKENRRGRQLAPKERQPGLVAKREQPQPIQVATTDAGSGLTRASRQTSPDDLPLEKRLAAKEQLMYALRLTSSKLSEVRAKTLGLGDAKQGFVEGNRK
jgi:hypothetical protein